MPSQPIGIVTFALTNLNLAAQSGRVVVNLFAPIIGPSYNYNTHNVASLHSATVETTDRVRGE